MKRRFSAEKKGNLLWILSNSLYNLCFHSSLPCFDTNSTGPGEEGHFAWIISLSSTANQDIPELGEAFRIEITSEMNDYLFATWLGELLVPGRERRSVLKASARVPALDGLFQHSPACPLDYSSNVGSPETQTFPLVHTPTPALP